MRPHPLMLVLLLAAGASPLSARPFTSYTPLDDFESYTVGNTISLFTTPLGNWRGFASVTNSVFSIQNDPTSGSNQVLRYRNGISEKIANNDPNLQISDGSTSTLYYRLRGDREISNPFYSPLNLRVTMADEAITSFPPSQYSKGETNTTVIEDGGDAEFEGLNIQDAWNEIWMVVDNSNDNFDLYARPEGGAQSQLLSDQAFANGTAANDLIELMLHAPFNSGTGSRGDVYFDDFFIAPGDAHTVSPLTGPITPPLAPEPSTLALCGLCLMLATLYVAYRSARRARGSSA